MTDSYRDRGFGTTTIGFGQRPAILVVDFQRGFTDPGQTLGGSALVNAAVAKTRDLLKVARAATVPVLQTYVAHGSGTDALNWKIPAVIDEFHEGKPATVLDPGTFDPDYDVVVRKNAPSILFQTTAISFLVKHRIDTTIIVGCNTSGCVRASAVDAFSYGFRVMVVEDCVGDVETGPHEDALRDLGRRYADIVSMSDVIEKIEDLRKTPTGV